jgi:hypothetical protein
MKPTKKRLSAFGPPLPVGMILLVALLLPTGCKQSLTDAHLSQAIYSPRILAVQAGTPIQTVEGIYTPSVNELWHSDAAFREQERRLRDAAFQITELRKAAKEGGH